MTATIDTQTERLADCSNKIEAAARELGQTLATLLVLGDEPQREYVELYSSLRLMLRGAGLGVEESDLPPLR
ncbi:MAG TPA: hypothetical protein VHC69_22200 [Polyangiaceae bacterium]|nr:hypothetical protein [Polyangiaceae bacterium]